MDATRILLREEIEAVLKSLHKRSKRSHNSRQNLAIFRLACCCGLRRKEIAGLNLNDVLTTGPRPAVRVRRAITKGMPSNRKTRVVPLWWDSGTLADLAAWKTYRQEMGAQPGDPLICALSRPAGGNRFLPKQVASRWKTAIRALGAERISQLSIHKGRHTCASHLLAAGIPGTVVRDVLGHGNISITDIYLHALPVDHITEVFGKREPSHA